MNSYFKAGMVLMLLSFFISSCKKENVSEENITITSETDVLKFENIESFQSFYEELNSLYDTNYEAFNQISSEIAVNTVLKKIENDVFSDPSKRYMPFLLDPIMTSIVNEHFEFQIGTQLFTIITNEFLLRFDANDKALQNRIRLMEKGALLDPREIPNGVNIVTDDSFEGLMTITAKKIVDVEESLNNELKGSCEKKEASIGYEWFEKWISGGVGYAISNRTRSYYSWSRTYEESKMFSYVYSNGNWSNEKVFFISTSICTKRRNSSCSETSEGFEDQNCSNCKNYKARVNVLGKKYHQTGDVKGSFALLYTQGIYNALLSEQEVEF